MGLYVVKEMFPRERILKRPEVNTLYENACKVVKYNMYCCYRLVDVNKYKQKFIHVHDNDGTESDLCEGPFIIRWIAEVDKKADTVKFLPYLSYMLLHPFDIHIERLDEWLNVCLHTLNIFPVDLDGNWQGSVHQNEVVLRHAVLPSRE